MSETINRSYLLVPIPDVDETIELGLLNDVDAASRYETMARSYCRDHEGIDDVLTEFKRAITTNTIQSKFFSREKYFAGFSYAYFSAIGVLLTLSCLRFNVPNDSEYIESATGLGLFPAFSKQVVDRVNKVVNNKAYVALRYNDPTPKGGSLLSSIDDVETYLSRSTLVDAFLKRFVNNEEGNYHQIYDDGSMNSGIENYTEGISDGFKAGILALIIAQEEDVIDRAK